MTNAIVPSDPRQFRLYELQEALIFVSPCRVVKATGVAGHLAAELTPAACMNGHANSILFNSVTILATLSAYFTVEF